MFNEDDLHELAEFQGSGVSVVTIYLDTDLTYQTKEKCKLTMWELFRRLDEEVPQEDQDRIEHFLDLQPGELRY